MSATSTRILGTGHYVPEQVLSNADLEKRVETSDEWIRTRTGIRERRIAADGEYTSDLAAKAAAAAIEAAEISPEQIDLVVVATVTGDQPLPATAMYVKRKLGLRKDCPGFDLAAACAGFVYGLTVGDQFIRGGGAKHVLVVGVELLSRFLDFTDRTTCVLFGDGAGAAVLGPMSETRKDGASAELLSTHIYADAELADALTIPAGGSRRPACEASVAERLHYVHMDGRQIFKFAVKALSSASQVALDANNLRAQDIDWVVPHQANTRILAAVGDRVGIEMERFYMNIDRYGNTSSASAPIALDEAVRDGSIKQGQHVLLCALGGGIAWGSALIRW